MKFITKKDLEKITAAAQAARDAVPKAHSRKAAKAYHAEMIRLLKSAKARTSGKIAEIVISEGYNYGTSKWRDRDAVVAEYCIGKFDRLRETEKSFILEREYGNIVIAKTRILALVKV